MATFKNTKNKYPKEYENGKTYYHTMTANVTQYFDNDSILNDNFHFTEFYTEAQKDYLSKMATWAWLKCHLSAPTCERIIKSTELSELVEHYALITHDKDNVEPHTHILIKFYRNERINTSLVEYFHCDNVKNVRSTFANRFKYLTHDSDACRKQGKYQYSKDEILTDNIEWWERETREEQKEVDDKGYAMVNDVLNGLPTIEMVKKYGKEYVYHRKYIMDTARAIIDENNNYLVERYEIHHCTDDYIALYDKATGLIHSVEKNIKDIKRGVYNEMQNSQN